MSCRNASLPAAQQRKCDMSVRTFLVSLVASCCLVQAWLTTAAAQIEAKDDVGQAILLKKVPQRLVSLAPSNTEILFALGVGDRLVGVSEFCDYPPEAAKLPQVAGFNTVNLEAIAAAQPELVVAIRGNDAEGLEGLRRLGIPVFALEIQTVEQVFTAIERLARLTGVAQRGKSLADSLRQAVKAVTVPDDRPRPRVLWSHLGEPVYTAGKDTYIDDALYLAGADNLGRRAAGAWPQIGLETLVQWAPEVIVTTDGRAAEDLAAQIERLRGTDGWKTLPAVQKGRVLYVEGDYLLRPGPRVVRALAQIAAYLHPPPVAPTGR